jgi:hypothetical protein
MTTTQTTVKPRKMWGKATFILLLTALSCIAAFGIDATQGRNLGDAPGAMLSIAFCTAVIAGTLRLASPIFVGMALASGFPVWAMIDLARNGGHGLLPFEFVFYASYGVFCIVGASVAHLAAMVLAFIVRRVRSRPSREDHLEGG